MPFALLIFLVSICLSVSDTQKITPRNLHFGTVGWGGIFFSLVSIVKVSYSERYEVLTTVNCEDLEMKKIMRTLYRSKTEKS